MIVAIVALPIAASSQTTKPAVPPGKAAAPVAGIFPEGTVVYNNVPYHDDTLQKHQLDLYLPAGRKGNVPVIVWIHGGAWRSNDKYADMGYMKQTIREILASGYAIASVDYLFSTSAVFPAQLYDCLNAVSFLYISSAKYGLDKNRIGLMGFSAGGHLASLLGLQSNNMEKKPPYRIRAVVDFYGPSDFIAISSSADTAANNDRSAVAVLLGAKPNDRPDLARAASPVAYVDEHDPPFLIIHGEKDDMVPVTQSVLLASWLRLKGVQQELVVVPGAPHYGEMFDAPAVRQKVIAFIKKNI
ncbi:MAG: alpha/beta hydrolase [Chitinophagaceae bacterium]|nr:MAG: alpha/beta hydrolase [Chitinophagaceae bacterium]